MFSVLCCVMPERGQTLYHWLDEQWRLWSELLVHRQRVFLTKTNVCPNPQ